MGNNCTVTIPSDNFCNLSFLTGKDLQAVKFAFNSPFQLNLADDQFLLAEEVVRLVPKRRMVVFGIWLEKPVVAKLFFAPNRAKYHLEKELLGFKTLRQNKIPTPALYYQGWSADKRVYVLLFERIFAANNLEEIWQQKDNIETLLPLLRGVTTELATHHVLGVLQHDLHLKNFLLTKKTIFTLDGAEIEFLPHLLSKKTSMESLALFLSQLGVGVEKYQEILFKHYAKSRGWILKPEDNSTLFFLIKKYNEARWQQFEKKIFRDCSNFASFSDWWTHGMYDRKHTSSEWMDFLKNPDAIFDHPETVILKAGRSSTVIKVMMNGKPLVIKRYNIKNSWHGIRRALRETRAVKSWRLAHKLNLFGIATAKPIAFIEKKYIGLRGKSYYVTEYVSGEHAGEFLMRHVMQEEKISTMVASITDLLKNIAKLEITHGDLKITNILIDANEKPTLIDLDGAAEHLSLSSLHIAWRKEIKRFLANFNQELFLQEKFKTALSEK